MPPVALRIVALVLVATASPCLVRAAMNTARTFGIPERRSLQVDVPLRWKDAVEWSADGRRVTFRLESGTDLLLQLVPVTACDADCLDADNVRATVEESARRTLGLGDGAELGIEKLARPDGAPGFFFKVHDRSVPTPPPPGTYQVMSQGALVVEDLLVTATILTQASASDELKQALALLRTARLTDDPPDAWRVPAVAPDPRGRPGLRYTLDLAPGFDVRRPLPFSVEHAALGATFSVDVLRDGGSSMDTIRTLRSRAVERLNDDFLLRRAGTRSVGGVEAQELRYADQRDGMEVSHLVVPISDGALVTTWRVPLGRTKEAASVEEALLGGFRVLP